MPTSFLRLLFLAVVIAPARLGAAPPDAPAQKPVLWDLNRLDMIGGHRPLLSGSPRLIETSQGKAIEFDGTGDALFLDSNPLAGLKEFTAEVVFQPYAGGPKEQRFVHLQEDGSENRLLFEIRLTDDNRWFLDTFLKAGDGNYTLLAERSPHPVGPWYAAAVVVDGKTMRHYVNGVEELSTAISFQPQRPGRASLGVRINKVSWYKGAIREVRITPRVLSPQEFLRP